MARTAMLSLVFISSLMFVSAQRPSPTNSGSLRQVVPGHYVYSVHPLSRFVTVPRSVQQGEPGLRRCVQDRARKLPGWPSQPDAKWRRAG
jgi:hypothetical protein